MKKYFFFILLTFILFIEVVSASITKDANFYNKINNSIDNYFNRELYLFDSNDMDKIPYEYLNKKACYNDKYSKTGLLNLEEFIAAGSKSSYLYSPRTSWMLTEDGASKTYVVTMNDTGYDSIPNSSYGEVAVTKYIKPYTKVLGSGTYKDPWRFDNVEERSSYKVKHYLQGLNEESTTLYKTETFSSDTYSYVTPDVLTITGFDSPTTKTVRVMPDNSTLVEYTYTRKKYTLKLEADAGVKNYLVNSTNVGSSYTQDYLYGSTISINVELNSIYSWKNWQFTIGQPTSFNVNTQNNSFVMGATNTTLKANTIKNYSFTLTASNEVQNYLINGVRVGTTYSNTYKSGDTIRIDVEFKDGYEFSNWVFSSGQPSSFVTTTKSNNINVTSSNISLKAVGVYSSRILSYKCSNTTVGTAPFDMTFSGKCQKVDESGVNWRFRLLSNGNLSLKNTQFVDVFLVGGGGGGGNSGARECGGGGGGYTKTYKNINVSSGASLPVVIGTGGRGGRYTGHSSGNGTQSTIKINNVTYSANGGYGGGNYGGNGGSGGSGFLTANRHNWCDPVTGGRFGKSGSGRAGSGQGDTTCEFGEGTTSSCYSGYLEYSKGGDAGHSATGCASSSGKDNTGAGGFGNPVALDEREGCPGSTGVVVIRNKR